MRSLLLITAAVVLLIPATSDAGIFRRRACVNVSCGTQVSVKVGAAQKNAVAQKGTTPAQKGDQVRRRRGRGLRLWLAIR